MGDGERERRGGKQPPPTRAKASAPTPAKSEGGAKTKASKKAKAPRHAAVTLTKAEASGPTVGEALAQVRKDRPGLLDELGIAALNPKRAATGGLILTVAGKEKADRLALVLTGLMADKSIKVARPVKMAEASHRSGRLNYSAGAGLCQGTSQLLRSRGDHDRRVPPIQQRACGGMG